VSKPFYVLSDADLLLWSANFSQKLTATPAAFGVTSEQAATYATLNTAFDTALAAWREPSTRTPVTSADKKAARKALLDEAKFLVAAINTNPAVTDAQREELGIRPRKKPTPVPLPDVSPMIDIEQVSGRRVTLRLHAEGRRGRPVGVKGASLFTAIGDEPPVEIEQWKFEGLTSRTSKVIVDFPESASASTVWVTANWYNERGQTGVACAPKRINLPATQPVPVTTKLKIAA
jgi:hypothetical protein